jgi:hypothetical protein
MLTDSIDPSLFDRPLGPTSAEPRATAQWIERTALADGLLAAAAAPGVRADPILIRAGAVAGYGLPGFASTLFNRVFVAGEGAPAAPEDLARVLDELAARGVDRPLLHLHPDEATPALEQVLAARSFTRYRRSWVKLLRAQGPVDAAPTLLTVRAARAEDAPAFAELMVEAHALLPETAALIAPIVERPGWHAYVALDGARLVATGALMVRGKVGYLSHAATRATHRSRGAQSALLEKRLRVAFALGCQVVVSETGEAVAGQPNTSYANMARAGLLPIGRRDNYARGGVAWQ